MFEAAELGQKVDKATYAARVPELVTRLLEAQRALRAAQVPVVIIVSGVEGAGKSEVVNRLTEWFDPRGVQVQAFWDETDEERDRPRHWRFWRRLPARGTIAVFFGSWYTQPIVARAFEQLTDAELERALARIEALERMLTLDGALIVKLWFHLSKKAQAARLKDPRKGRKGEWKLSPLTKKFAKRYGTFARLSDGAIRATDTQGCPWHIIDSEDRRHRDLAAAETVLTAIERRLAAATAAAPGASSAPAQAAAPASAPAPAISPTVLDQVDLAASRLSPEDYDRQIEAEQRRLFELAWEARRRRVSSVIVFEGWDAAGKGGAIRRVAAALDARLLRVIPIAAPTDEERAHHYLWRFWRHLPLAGYLTIFDRSWYGRVLVERVEGFASPDEWGRAYREISAFEEQLVDHGMALTKLWLHMSKDEQLARFQERQRTAWKQHKITDEDWRNREKWDAYALAIHDMVARTSTAAAPWTIVAAEDKRWARVQVVRTIADRLAATLG
ncbi:MAG: polyphosphate:AMP phosphotransferase [Planctomycetota bacterium]|nr:polyphosphate:AMP phosphotransferase [Planctomycetota bacterium]